jgi:hypothetical protein
VERIEIEPIRASWHPSRNPEGRLDGGDRIRLQEVIGVMNTIGRAEVVRDRNAPTVRDLRHRASIDDEVVLALEN